MKITAENNQYRQPGKQNKPMSIVASGLVGATVGYASKYALPVSKEEMDNFYPAPAQFVKATKEGIKEQQLNELESLRRQLGKNVSPKTDEFLSAMKSNIKDGEKKSLLNIYHGAQGDKTTQKILRDVVSQVVKTKKFVTKLSQEAQKSIIKQSRDTFKFVSVGAAIAVGTAFVHNVVESISND